MPKRSARRRGSPRVVLILAAYPRRAAAARAAKLLVAERVLACATVAPGARASYVWRGRRHDEASTLLYGKTSARRAAEALRRLRETHPDRVPEILVLEVAGGDPAYLAWVEEEVSRR